MYHALLLQPEVLRELPALLDDRGSREEQAAWPCYRSEAFAEDLLGSELSAAPERRVGTAVSLLLCATPVCAAVFGGALALFGVVA
jgi:hypothetical protein